MEFKAERLNTVQPSPTVALNTRAKELIAAGRDIIGFTAGEPDFDTPAHIKAAAIRAMDEGRTKYTPVGGTAQLKKAIIHKFKTQNNLEYETTEVTASNGGKQVLFNVLLSVLNPGDNVIFPAPYWVSYVDMVRLAGAEPNIVQCSVENDFRMTGTQLRESINPETRAIILNSPSNPTGAYYNREQLGEIVDVLKDYPDILIITDDIYEHILYEGREFVNPLMLAPELKDRTVIINGVSKAYSMTGWRIGFGAGPSSIIKNMETIQSQCTSNPCSIAQAAAVAAITESQDCVQHMLKAFDERRMTAFKILGSMPGVKTFLPQGAFYIFPDMSGIYQTDRFQELKAGSDESSDSRLLCKHLLDHFDVAAVPGIAFGEERGIRISYALGEDKLRIGLQRLGNMLSDFN